MYGKTEHFSYRLIPSQALVAAGYPVSRFNDPKDSLNQFTPTNIATPYNQPRDLQNLNAAFAPHAAILNAGHKLAGEKKKHQKYGFFSSTEESPEDEQLALDLEHIESIYLKWAKLPPGADETDDPFFEPMQSSRGGASTRGGASARDSESVSARTRSAAPSTSGTRDSALSGQPSGSRPSKRLKRSRPYDE